MSVRPSEVATEASRFSLRHVFGSAASPRQQQQPTAAGLPIDEHLDVRRAVARLAPTAAPAPPSEPALPQQLLRFDLGGAAGAVGAKNGGIGGATGLRFTLPTMRGSAEASALPLAMRVGAAAEGGKKLQAGYITGGASKASEPEIMRLNGVIDDLHTKLRKSSERIATAEQSVARGNAALQSERAMSHARIVALAGEVKNAQQREAAVRAELAALPKAGDLDRAKFEMQARGAVELQAHYDEEVQRARALEDVVSGVTGKHEALVAEHAALQAQLDEAHAQLADVRQQAVALAAAAPTEAIAPAACDGDGVDVQQEQWASDGPPEPPPLGVSADEHLEAVEALQRALFEARGQLEAQEARASAAVAAEAHDADAVIKTLELKLAAARTEARDAQDRLTRLEDFTATMSPTGACGGEHKEKGEEEAAAAAAAAAAEKAKREEEETTARPPIPDEVRQEYRRFFDLQMAAKHAIAVATNATALDDAAAPARVAEALHKRANVHRAYRSMLTGRPAAPLVGCCAGYDDLPDEPPVDTARIRFGLETGLNQTGARMGVASVCAVDCDVDLHAVPVATGTLAMPHTTEMLGLKMRTDKYVDAVSTDIKAKLVSQRKAWVFAQTGQRVLPEDQEAASA